MFRVTDVNGHPVHSNKKSFICQTDADISKLPRVGVAGTQVLDELDEPDANEPVGFGSTATVQSPFGVYQLGADNNWSKI